MALKNYAVLESDGTVWGVIVCEPSKIRQHVQALGFYSYIRRPDELPDGNLRRLEPGSKILGFSKAGAKIKNVADVEIRGVTETVAAPEIPADEPGEEI